LGDERGVGSLVALTAAPDDDCVDSTTEKRRQFLPFQEFHLVTSNSPIGAVEVVHDPVWEVVFT